MSVSALDWGHAVSEQPSFVFFITDQQRADFVGYAGHPALKTPNIDGIAATGTRFDRFYVSSPICMPNRATLMTGRPSSLHGVRHNGLPLSPDATTFTDVLREAGYATGLVGKSHLRPFGDRGSPLGPSPSAEAGYPEATRADHAARRALREFPNDDPAENPEYEIELPFYGFDHVELATGHGDRCRGDYGKWLADRVEDPTALRGPENQLPHNYSVPQGVRTAIPEEFYSTSYIRDRAVDYVRNLDETRPVFLFVSFPDPHHPFTPPGKYWDMYDPGDMVVPPFGHETNAPPPLDFIRSRSADPAANRKTMKAFAAETRDIQEAQALTCGMISMIDDAVGAVLAALEERKLSRSTVTIFTSDHGDYMGDHGLLLKGPLHYQSVIRVPFVWREPGQSKPATSTYLCSTLDIAKTVLRRAGLTPYNGIKGEDLATAMADGGPERDSLLIEEEIDNELYGFAAPKKIRTLMTQRHRLTVFMDEEWGELYDLKTDPGEMNNLWGAADHASIKSELMEQLVRELVAAGETSPWPDWLA